MYYRCVFEIDGSEGADAQSSVDRLARTVSSHLAAGREQGHTESGEGPETRFWELTVERPTLDRSGDAIRLEIRSHAEAGRCRAQVLTRYLNGRGREPERPTFPPLVLEKIAAEISCRTTDGPLSWAARRLGPNDAHAFALENISNAGRKQPTIIVTRGRDGRGERRADRMQRATAGVATVALVADGATRALRDAVGKATYGGAMRLVEPGVPTRSRYYREVPDLRELVDECMALSGEDDFDERHEAIRETLAPDKDTPLRNAEARIEQLEAQLAAARAAATGGTAALEIGMEGADNVTLINHAVNLARDPLRNYVVEHLVRDLGKAGATAKVTALRSKRGMSARRIAEDLAGAIDVNDMAHLLSYRHDDAGSTMAGQLRELKQIRNLAAHPPPGGVSADQTIDKLTMIRNVMQQIGERETAERISAVVTLQRRRRRAGRRQRSRRATRAVRHNERK